jgi:histone acetyltransferase (RNA polymerase elongator complex component)
MRHYNIPIFIPELACPNQCVYCNQRRITGHDKPPDVGDIKDIVKAYLATMQDKDRYVELAFFGGNFTGLPISMQRAYLNEASSLLAAGTINGIRLSTRPDYINQEVLDLLVKHHVSSVELGAQSLDDEVLKLSERGHTAKDVEAASMMIRNANIDLVLQMMIGLPGDTLEKSMYTARKILEFGAVATRIYPALVIKGTHLEKLMLRGEYHPLSLEETILQCKELLSFFESNNIAILRLGLHPSEGLISGCEMAAGPFHPALKELVMTSLWEDALSTLLSDENKKNQEKQLTITVAPSQLNAAIGHTASNRILLEKSFKKVVFKSDSKLIGREFHAHYC